MIEDSPSRTAIMVAVARGVATLPSRSAAPARDPFAARVVAPLLGGVLDGLTPLAARTSGVSWLLRLGSLGFVDHIALRTAALDRAVREACLCGVSQVVILGAGLDARAWRLPELADRTVYEVDHPATQRYKRGRVAGLDPVATDLRFVSVDFMREDLGERLAAEGHDESASTLWLWEGVMPYLPIEASRQTLLTLAARSAPGSTLAVTYATEDDPFWRTKLSKAVYLGFRWLGEPLHGLLLPEAMRALLDETGWTLERDTGPQDWREHFGYGHPRLLTIDERLALAVI